MDATSVSATQTTTATKPVMIAVADPNIVYPEKIYCSDPLYRLLKGQRIVFNDYVIAGTIGAITAIGLFVLGPLLLLSFHWTWQYIVSGVVQSVLVFPVLLLIYLHMPRAMADLFNVIQSNNVIEDLLNCDPRVWPNNYPEFVQRYTGYASRWWWTAGAMLFVLLYITYRVVLLLLTPTLQAPAPLTFELLNILNNALIVYCVTLAILWLIAGLLFSNKLFRSFCFHLTPLHPDGCAGLGQMENALWISTILLATLGIAALVMNAAFVSGHFDDFSVGEAITFIVVYLSLIPTLLLGWTLVPHRVMVDGCNEVLQPLANKFKTTISVDASTDNESSATIKENTDKMAELKRRYRLLQDTFPLWPTQRFTRHIATMGIPAIITFVGGLPAIYRSVEPFVAKLFH